MHVANRTEVEPGGLKLGVSFRESAGATLRVNGRVDGAWTELPRFDDFVDDPHYHEPASGAPIGFERDASGEPLAWYIAPIRDNLAAMLPKVGYGQIVPQLDLEEVRNRSGEVQKLMEDCVPAGYTRVPGVGLQRVAG